VKKPLKNICENANSLAHTVEHICGVGTFQNGDQNRARNASSADGHHQTKRHVIVVTEPTNYTKLSKRFSKIKLV
jgi:hypothetical protein